MSGKNARETMSPGQMAMRKTTPIRGQDGFLCPEGGNGDRQWRRVSLAEEIRKARASYCESLSFAQSFMQDARSGRRIDFDRSESVVETMVGSVMRNQDALVGMKHFKASSEYSCTHSVNVALLSIILGYRLEFSRDELMALGQAALFHDVGMALIPQEVLSKPSKLSDSELALVRDHPRQGERIVRGIDRVKDDVLRGILEHHERYDGSGYPVGLAGQSLSKFAQVIGVADSYDARTSESGYKKAVSPQQALHAMYCRDKCFAPAYVERFINCLGLYPVGSFVRLSDGNYAVVVGSNSEKPFSPTVKVIRDLIRRPVEPRLVDLALDEECGEQIVDVLDAWSMSIDPMSYLS